MNFSKKKKKNREVKEDPRGKERATDEVHREGKPRRPVGPWVKRGRRRRSGTPPPEPVPGEGGP